MIQTYFGHDPLEPGATSRTCPRFAQVVVNHHDAVRSPSQVLCAAGKFVLQACRLLMHQHLLGCRLAYIHHGQTLSVPGADLVRSRFIDT